MGFHPINLSKDLNEKYSGPTLTLLDSLSGTLSSERWYVAEVYRGKEQLAVSHLGRQGFSTFFPRFKRRDIRRSIDRTILAPVFPGYVFVLLDLETQNWSSINSTRGVKKLVGSTLFQPQRVPPQAMALLQQRCRGGIMVDLVEQFAPGDLVQINTGPLAQRIAKIESFDADDRVSLLFEIMGSDHTIKVDRASIGPVLRV